MQCKHVLCIKQALSPITTVSLLGVQDYYNLVDVYLDAVLQPRCVTDPKTFAQEGWHYELDDPKVCIESERSGGNAFTRARHLPCQLEMSGTLISSPLQAPFRGCTTSAARLEPCTAA